jgi:hypothetical protein
VSKPADTQSDEDLVDFLGIFIADLHDAPMNINVSAWVDGLWLSCPSVTASEIQLRRPEARDFEYERSFDLQLSGLSVPWSFSTSPAIASFQVRGTSTFGAPQQWMPNKRWVRY